MSIDDIVKLLSGQAGVLFFLILAILAGSKRLWVWGYQLRDAEKRAQEWEERFLASLDQTEKATALAHKAIDNRKDV